MNLPCLSPDELLAARARTLPAARRAHLEACSLCRDALDALELHGEYAAAGDLTAPAPTFEESLRPVGQPTAAAAAAVSRPPSRLRASGVGVARLVRFAGLAAAACLLVYAGVEYAALQRAAPATDFDTDDALAYVEQPFVRAARGDDADAPADVFAEAAAAFEAQAFREASLRYREALAGLSNEALVARGRYELGISLWRAGDPEAATEELTAARFASEDYHEDATWALAQLYRDRGAYPQARQLLGDLAAFPGSPYAARAEALLEILRRPEYGDPAAE